jgi:GH24 family phage-related lysozyme (muramidase)
MRFTEPLEGRVHWMYLDVLGLVTTGIGNLVDPVYAALRLPWKRPDGNLASVAEVRGDWERLKARQDLRKLHFKYAAGITTVRLTDADIENLVIGKLLENERYMLKALPDWDEFPADAQLGISSMAWAVGPGFTAKFGNFTRAANKQDWIGGKASCAIRTEGNPGVIPRNKANERCFENAAFVIANNLDRAVLHWPSSATVPELEAPTVPIHPVPELTDADRARAAAARIDDIGIIRDEALRYDLTDRDPPKPPEDGGNA